jgi:integration host factor subunit alpha
MSMTLTKAEIADHLFTALNIPRLMAKEIVDQTFEEIRYALEHGQSVKLSSFGNFELRNKLPRPGRNPRTGEEKLISARRVVTFKAGQKLKAKVESGSGPQDAA